MYHIDVKHLLILGSRLRNFKQKNDGLWNASCPVCGDSKSKKTKARLYFFKHNNTLLVKCHNCQYSATFSKFLQRFDPTAHKDYAFEKWSNNNPGKLDPVKPVEEQKKARTERLRTLQELSIPSIADLVEGQPARSYIASRKIPEKYWPELFYAKDYKGFLDKDFPGHGKKDVANDERIVIPFVNQDNYVSTVTGRALHDFSIRYISVKILNEHKVYGLNRVEKDAPIYLVEGPFDSLFLPNAIASGDSNLVGTANYMLHLGFTDVRLVFDNEPRNAEIVEQMEFAIEGGFRVVIQPQNKYKDLNEAVVDGVPAAYLKKRIDEYTYRGLEARMRLAEWRKC